MSFTTRWDSKESILSPFSYVKKQKLSGIKWLAQGIWLTSHRKLYVVFCTRLREILSDCMSQTRYWLINMYLMPVQKFASHSCLLHLCSSVDKVLERVESVGKYWQLLNPTDPFFSPWRNHTRLLLLWGVRIAGAEIEAVIAVTVK